MSARISHTAGWLCLIIGVVGPVPSGADIGRLFFTPAERGAFEQARRLSNTAAKLESDEPESNTATDLLDVVLEEPKPIITLDGYVRRSNGQASLWIDGEYSYDGDLSANWVRDGKVSVTPMDSDTAINLKPGQSYDPNSATITDAYETAIQPDDFVVY